MKRLFLGLLALSALAASPALAANQLTNGSFEDGTTGWTPGGGSVDGYPPSVIDYNSNASYPTGAFGEPVPPDFGTDNPGFDEVGTHAIYFVADLANPQTLTQTVHTVAGREYTFGFDYYVPQNGFNNPFGATITAGVAGLDFQTFSAGAETPVTWTHFSTTAIATISGPTTFTFAFNSFGYPAKDFVIDRVYFSGAVPEPATWAMMLVGFGGLGAVLRRRRAATAFAAA